MEKIKTTIELKGAIVADYVTLTKRYGVNSTVAAGVLLLARLGSDKREAIIDEVSGSLPSGQKVVAAADAAAKRRKARQEKQRQPSEKVG